MVYASSSGFLTLFIGLLSFSFSANAQTTFAIENSSAWCMFMPPTSGGNVADYEKTAVSFCTAGGVTTAPGSKVFPTGLIRTANYLKSGSAYVQITGALNPAAYFNASDGGGQFDSDGSPVGALCTGYKYFVNIIEPSNSRYCIRCCNSRTGNTNLTDACLFDHSSDGCAVVVPNGNYSGQTIPGISSVPAGNSSTRAPSTSLPLSSTVSNLSTTTTASGLNSSATLNSSTASESTLSSSTAPAATTLPNVATSMTVSTITVFFCIAGFAVVLL